MQMPLLSCEGDDLPSFTPRMAPTSFQPPNAIPPRRSSSGYSMSISTPAKDILKPVSEADWLASGPGKRLLTTSVASSPPGQDPPPTIGEIRQGDQRGWSLEKEKILLGPFDYLLNHPGKDIRRQLIAAFNELLKVPDESLEIITKVVGMLHTASLL